MKTYNIDTNRGQERGPSIQFESQDLERVVAPHGDALVIRVTIANYNMARVFVDTSSLVNVLYKDTFNRIQIDREELQPMATSLFGFTGYEVRPLGQIQLSLSLGEEPLRQTHSLLFTVVDAPSSYNIILGRPALSSFGAIVSTFYQKLKFPIYDQVGSVSSDQGITRKCYIGIVQTDLHEVRRKQKVEVNLVQDTPLSRPT